MFQGCDRANQKVHIREREREGSKRALSPKLSKKQSINRLTYSPGIKIRRKSFLRVFIQRHQDCSSMQAEWLDGQFN